MIIAHELYAIYNVYTESAYYDWIGQLSIICPIFRNLVY